MAPRTVSKNQTKKQKMEATDTHVPETVAEDVIAKDSMTDTESESDANTLKPRRGMVDPLEIKALLMQDTKGARTKAIKLLERLSKQLEKIQNKMAKKKAAGPRKLSAYNVYTKKHMADVQDIESKLRMKELGQRWKALSPEERAPYVALAAQQST